MTDLLSYRPAITLIVAHDRQRVIGRDGTIPWRLSDDLRHFRRSTKGKPIVMGRRTYEEMGRPLPKRHNIVLTRGSAENIRGLTPAVSVVNSPEQAIAAAAPAPELIIGGGTAIYAAFLPLATQLIITNIDADVGGDTYFPAVDFNGWHVVNRQSYAADERNDYSFEIVWWQRTLPTLEVVRSDEAD